MSLYTKTFLVYNLCVIALIVGLTLVVPGEIKHGEKEYAEYQ